MEQEEIRTIAEIIWGKHETDAMLAHLHFNIITDTMRELGYSEEQIAEHRVDVSRVLRDIRRRAS